MAVAAVGMQVAALDIQAVVAAALDRQAGAAALDRRAAAVALGNQAVVAEVQDTAVKPAACAPHSSHSSGHNCSAGLQRHRNSVEAVQSEKANQPAAVQKERCPASLGKQLFEGEGLTVLELIGE